MSMVVQHNMQAANANRMLGITSGAQAKSTEKLSSGYKINRAADDAEVDISDHKCFRAWSNRTYQNID